ncbi:hypothetical protein MIND_00252600 [Mycena indigotica]|uniref:F-box domain-containing protein n=1 Tax=Mycena indigotica TaxID=2126181 RepID=A0A8H6WF07_9AGAR|nr:uncharacterized protein MIND_00252600 [Mycena indigotica]KAF7312393.1 hypothetical protein MIND_00252600 [Mycena indigotica]
MQLPAELWLRISNFLTQDEVVALVGVNLTFFNIALDIRYRTIHIETWNSKSRKLYERLRDPLPASRVQRLILRPHLSLSNPIRSESSRPAASPSLWHRLFSAGSSSKAQPPPASKPAPIEQLIESLILVLPGLVNLRSFEAEVWDVEEGYDLRPFFRSAWAAFGPKLEAVSFGGRPKDFLQFVESEPNIPACTSLNLQFTHEMDTAANAATLVILVDCVAPYINSIALQLTTFKVWSWSTLDLSALFLNLGKFPRLTEFHVRAPFNRAFTDPAGLTNLLETNSQTLQHVELRLNPSGSAMDPSPEQRLGEWFSSHQSSPLVMRDLKKLRLFPTNSGLGFDALLMYLERSANTLTTLAIKDRYLSLEEVSTLTTLLAERESALQNLRLHVRVWSPELFDLLAAKLPGLRSLSLYVGGSPGDRAAEKLFFAKLRNGTCRQWTLYDIGVWQGGFEVSLSTMRSLAACIPSIRSFWNNGEMWSDSKNYEVGFTHI